MAKSTGIVIGVLLLIIVVLALFLIYAFAVRPAITGYQIKGAELAVVSIIQQAATCQTVPLGYGNQTIEMIWIECLRQQQQTQPLQ